MSSDDIRNLMVSEKNDVRKKDKVEHQIKLFREHDTIMQGMKQKGGKGIRLLKK